MLGPLTRFPPRDLTASSGLSTSRSDAKLSLFVRDLLRGAPALTATGLSPASLTQQESLSFWIAIRSGRTMDVILQALRGASARLPTVCNETGRTPL